MATGEANNDKQQVKVDEAALWKSLSKKGIEHNRTSQ